LANKVPAITLAFWITKICATTLGETAGDALSMTLKLGYALSTCVFLVVFVGAVGLQIAAKGFSPWRYWFAVLGTTMVGTTISDFLDRTAHLGYLGGSALLVGVLILVLGAWRLAMGRIAFDHIANPKVEAFYWVTILVSNTLGTALGDFMSDNLGLGYVGGALVIGSVIAVISGLYFFTRLSRALLFWAAFVLTRPLGATLGDLLTKSHAKGGLDLGTFAASLVLAGAMSMLILAANRSRRPAALPT
jgi:uncharacterized membrane-anchored protein